MSRYGMAGEANDAVNKDGTTLMTQWFILHATCTSVSSCAEGAHGAGNVVEGRLGNKSKVGSASSQSAGVLLCIRGRLQNGRPTRKLGLEVVNQRPKRPKHLERSSLGFVTCASTCELAIKTILQL